MNGVLLGYAVVAALVGLAVVSFVLAVIGVLLDREPQELGLG